MWTASQLRQIWPAYAQFRADTRRVTLNPSGPAKPDRHLLAVDDHRHRAASLAVAEHPLERRRVLLDVVVLDRHLPPRVIVPGGSRVGSRVLAEDVDHTSLIVRRAQRYRSG